MGQLQQPAQILRTPASNLIVFVEKQRDVENNSIGSLLPSLSTSELVAA